MSEEEQVQTWEEMYEAVRNLLGRSGQEDHSGQGDYWILDDNYGFQSNKILIHNFNFLRPQLIVDLGKLLIGAPDWEIIVAIDIPGAEKTMPPMGIKVRANGIVDELRREYLPANLKNIKFG
jgi:hypothetical protein